MFKKKLTRVTAGILAGVLFIGLCACGEKAPAGSGETAGTHGEGKLFTEPTTIKIVTSSHVSWPYNENWKLWKYFQEATGATFEIQAIPGGEDFATKINLMMAAKDTLPDLMHIYDKTLVAQHEISGAFVPITVDAENMPYMTAFFDTIPEVERKELFMQRTAADGKLYIPPTYGTQTIQNLRTWMYRKDVFDKHKLQPPKTFDDLYTVAKTLKQAYPESYPLCMRGGLYQLEIMGTQWAPYFTEAAYYNFDENEWHYGAREETMHEMTAYLHKLQSEGLVPPDFITIETKSWEELMSTDRGFMSLDYIVRLDFFNVPKRQENPDYTLAVMAPPRANSAQGSNRIAKTNLDLNGYAVCNTGKDQSVKNALKLLDWMYSDQAEELLSWGKEGETFNIVDGKKKFILPNADSSPSQEYGTATPGLMQRIAIDAFESAYTDEQVQEGKKSLSYCVDYANPTKWMPLTDAESGEAVNLQVEIKSFVDENLSKFILGQRPMSEWDAFQAELAKMDIDRLLEIYKTAYDRVRG